MVYEYKQKEIEKEADIDNYYLYVIDLIFADLTLLFL